MARKAAILLKCFWGIFPIFLKHTACSLYEEQLYEDLLYLYNRVARPVKNTSDILTITMGASLIRIIEIRWTDAKLSWNPQKYGGLKRLHIPTDEIWTPDIVLYNHAAGHPEITIYTDAFVYYDGTVVWRPPAIYKAFCHIDVTWFPFDSQKCQMKFGVWTYTGSYIDMRHLPDQEVLLRNSNGKQYEYLQQGMDLSYFYDSAEWDLLKLTSERHERVYESCCGTEKYVDITYTFRLRRKALFFTVNLIMPCFLISFLTTFIFYLSDHKITLAISMLVTLIVFFLVLIELIPPTSLVIPMFGRYLLTTMILVTLGIVISVISVNFNFRCGTMETMAPWIRKVFLQILPKILRMKMPQLEQSKKKTSTQQILKNLDSVTLQRSEGHKKRNSRLTRIQPPPIPSPPMIVHSHSGPLEDSANSSPSFVGGRKSPANQQQFQIHVHRQLILRVLQHVRFIADHFKLHEEEGKVSSEWTFVAMVMDRLFLVIFAVLNIFSVLILLQAPSLYDKSEPLTAPSPTKPLGQDTLGRSFHLYE